MLAISIGAYGTEGGTEPPDPDTARKAGPGRQPLNAGPLRAGGYSCLAPSCGPAGGASLYNQDYPAAVSDFTCVLAQEGPPIRHTCSQGGSLHGIAGMGQGSEGCPDLGIPIARGCCLGRLCNACSRLQWVVRAGAAGPRHSERSLFCGTNQCLCHTAPDRVGDPRRSRT